MIKNIVKEKLTHYYNNDDKYNYDIEDSCCNWWRYMKYCKNYDEKLLIAMMLYIANVTIKELKTWNKAKLEDYMYETGGDNDWLIVKRLLESE